MAPSSCLLPVEAQKTQYVSEIDRLTKHKETTHTHKERKGVLFFGIVFCYVDGEGNRKIGEDTKQKKTDYDYDGAPFISFLFDYLVPCLASFLASQSHPNSLPYYYLHSP